MNWLKKIFAGRRGAGNGEQGPVGSTAMPSPQVSLPEAQPVQTLNVREWCDRLQREGERTGNQRLLMQARNIRVRHGL